MKTRLENEGVTQSQIDDAVEFCRDLGHQTTDLYFRSRRLFFVDETKRTQLLEELITQVYQPFSLVYRYVLYHGFS